ncbi:hypothetical protein GGX14DRAFT_373160 [Mycena pura]|uniref:Integrase core domain-containing protein n=1 Tax=Mycena pura TaxID=153505 RepID=A0AAD6YAI1_9AGAR|nr:hypothetical protein GGX14DRAFT_373160 [Mycena pura]
MPGNPLLKGKEKSGNNSRGMNGVDNGEWPEEDVLKESLMRYASTSQPLASRKQKLFEEHGLDIGLTMLKKLNKYFNVPSSRKPIPREVADQLVLNEMADDANKHRGPQTVQQNLALAGHNIPRRIIRETMLLNDPEGYDGRYPGRKRIKRAQLKAHGTWQEIHMDGHEKLGAQALEMGGIGFPIYGMKDKWGTGILYLSVVPDDRHSDVIGHVFLDFVELYGAIPQQVTTDKGSETGHIYGFMTGLKSTYAPHIDLTRYPCHVALKSTNNTPIEGLWRWFQDQCGKNLHLHIIKGRDEGIFNPNNQIHVLLVNWIWPPIIQGELDHFTHRWNSHVIRRQRNKLMPSGVSPNELHAHPEHYAGRCFAIPVPDDAILALRNSIKISREAALRWVPEEFDIMARQVYEGLGSPVTSAETAWELFSQMAAIMH